MSSESTLYTTATLHLSLSSLMHALDVRESREPERARSGCSTAGSARAARVSLLARASFSLSLSLDLRTERDRLLYIFLYGRGAQISMSYARTSAGGSIVSCLHPRSVDSLSRRGDN